MELKYRGVFLQVRKDITRSLVIVGVFALTACAQLQSLTQPNIDELKARIAKLVQKQRSDKAWMSMAVCPFDLMPEKSRRPNASVDSCTSNPESCLEKCDAKDADACYFLANLIQEHDKIENDVAEVLYQRSCELGIVSGCTNRAANIFERNEKEGNVCAARTFEKTCSQDDPWGCAMFGFVLGEGIGREKSVPSALSALKKACDVSIDKNGGACKRANEVRELIERSQKPN